MTREVEERHNFAENLVEASSDESATDKADAQPEARVEDDEETPHTKLHEEHKSPLEEITSALREKAVKFLATRDYQVQLPDFFFEGSTVKISPREVDERGALIRVDFGERALESEGRIFFKKISKLRQFKNQSCPSST